MANVKTFNLTIYFVAGTFLTFRGISRVAVNRYIEHYMEDDYYDCYQVEAR
jgi:hypothetical protein